MIKNLFRISVFAIIFSNILNSQEGLIKVNSSNNVKLLLEIKKDVNKSNGELKIQVFSGSRTDAEEILKKFNLDFPESKAVMTYETPNYKIWTKALKNKLEADRELIKIRKKYNQAFYFREKSKKDIN
ncbi:MAG: SPOR domain-containing protein [Flavobacteriaceae bacterium]